MSELLSSRSPDYLNPSVATQHNNPGRGALLTLRIPSPRDSDRALLSSRPWDIFRSIGSCSHISHLRPATTPSLAGDPIGRMSAARLATTTVRGFP